MLKAILFDFNGVLADDETSHFRCFQRALAEFGLSITADDYYRQYLGMDERTCTALLLETRDGRCDDGLLRTIMDRKADLFAEDTAQIIPPLFPGVLEFVTEARRDFRLAVASGGRRAQIDRALAHTAIAEAFEVIVSADDCAIGKPDPAIYLLALQRLNGQAEKKIRPLAPEQCLVIEDSRAGIRAARAAGMNVVALCTTYPAMELTEADLVLPGLEAQRPTAIARVIEPE
jgi:HAD superfamily hydrolase (TIGR01509 family)